MNCFAYERGCTILINGKCNVNCAFYKTHYELKREREAAFAKIAEMSAAKQSYISDKYYNGKKPWKAVK